jgi:hypothetical protein
MERSVARWYMLDAQRIGCADLRPFKCLLDQSTKVVRLAQFHEAAESPITIWRSGIDEDACYVRFSARR